MNVVVLIWWVDRCLELLIQEVRGVEVLMQEVRGVEVLVQEVRYVEVLIRVVRGVEVMNILVRISAWVGSQKDKCLYKVMAKGRFQ